MPSSPFLEGNYAPVADELAVHGLPIAGRLPDALRGTLYRNGPNPKMPPAEPYHWFTGDGMVHAVRLADGQASYCNRWVRTPRLLAEQQADRPLFAAFGRRLGALPAPVDAGVANTHVIHHAGRLLALEEAHLPMRLDPADLATLGYDDFGGALSGQFTAHPKHDPATGQLVFFSYSADGPFSPGMTWGTIEPSGVVSRLERFQAPYCSMVHDVAVTAEHVVFPVLPLTGDMGRAASGRPPFAWEPDRGGFLGVLRRADGVASLTWQPCEPRFVFHVMNAFDSGGAVVLDVVEYDAAPLFPRADGGPPEPAHSRLCRWRVDPGGRTAMQREVLDEHGGEFPRIDERRAGLPYAHGFRIGEAPGGSDALIHHDLARRSRRCFAFQPGERASEAVFVPAHPGAPEGEGWLLTVLWRPEPPGSTLLVLDAQAVERGPVASVQLPQRVPFGFHGSWVPADGHDGAHP